MFARLLVCFLILVSASITFGVFFYFILSSNVSYFFYMNLFQYLDYRFHCTSASQKMMNRFLSIKYPAFFFLEFSCSTGVVKLWILCWRKWDQLYLKVVCYQCTQLTRNFLNRVNGVILYFCWCQRMLNYNGLCLFPRKTVDDLIHQVWLYLRDKNN